MFYLFAKVEMFSCLVLQLASWCPAHIHSFRECVFFSTAAGCGRVSPERSSHSQENCCQRGGGSLTKSLYLFCLTFRFQHTWSLLIFSYILSISSWTNHCVHVCVWFQMISPLSLEQALSARDSLAKAIYGRAFTWLVQKLNQSLAFKVCFFFLSWGLSSCFKWFFFVRMSSGMCGA